MYQKIKLLLTYDYELPLGSCVSYNKGLFSPSEKIIKLAEELKVPLVFFVDICSAIVFKKWDYDNYYLPFKNQIQELIKKGNDVQLHIHPHWLDSTYKNGSFFPSDSYILSDFKNNAYPNNIEGVVKQSVDELNEICLEADPNYKCIAYRGGGYNLYPDRDKIISALYNNGIRIDSTMLKNYYYKSDLKCEDYRTLPKKQNWYINLDGKFTNKIDKAILEIPVTTMPAFLSERIKRVVKKIKNKEKYKKLIYNHTGTGMIGTTSKTKDKILNGVYSPFVLSFDNLTTDVELLERIINYQTKKYSKQDELILCVNSHPKGFGEHQFNLMKDFITKIKSNNKFDIEFTTLKQINLEQETK